MRKVDGPILIMFDPSSDVPIHNAHLQSVACTAPDTGHQPDKSFLDLVRSEQTVSRYIKCHLIDKRFCKVDDFGNRLVILSRIGQRSKQGVRRIEIPQPVFHAQQSWLYI